MPGRPSLVGTRCAAARGVVGLLCKWPSGPAALRVSRCSLMNATAPGLGTRKRLRFVNFFLAENQIKNDWVCKCENIP